MYINQLSKHQLSRRSLTHLSLFMVALLTAQTGLYAQGRGGRGGGGRGAGGAAGGAANAQASAPIDLTGYWVSIITEDWRYRMVTPSKGDYQGVPMTPTARTIADAWDPDKEAASGDQCKSYGAPALLRVPNRLHITWQDDNTMKLESDAGKQTRIFHFGAATPNAETKIPLGPPSLQGDSVAEFEGGGRGGRGGGRGGGGGGPALPADGTLKVTTTNLKGGYLRKNGVPYSDKTTLVEYFDLIHEPNGDPVIVVTIATTDPTYLRGEFVISSQYKKEASDAKWKPTECSAKW